MKVVSNTESNCQKNNKMMENGEEANQTGEETKEKTWGSERISETLKRIHDLSLKKSCFGCS